MVQSEVIRRAKKKPAPSPEKTGYTRQPYQCVQP